MTYWAPITTVTPVDGTQVEVDSPIAAARVRIERDALALLLARTRRIELLENSLAERRLMVEACDELPGSLTLESLAVWNSHNWSLSLSYYLWSRRTAFADDGRDEAATERRAHILSAMLADDACPEQIVPHTEPALNLSEGETRSDCPPQLSLGETLQLRRSSFRPKGGTLRRADLAYLLCHGGKRFIRARLASSKADKTTNLLISYGSALDVYVLIYRSPDLATGVYVLDPVTSSLHLIRDGQVAYDARAALLAHPEPKDAAATVALVSQYPRYQWRYRHERAMRTLWIDAGRILQDLVVCATSMGMETGITPAVADSLFLRLLDLDYPDSQVVHTLTFSGVAVDR